MFRVTVIMLRLIVESVILLKDEDCQKNVYKISTDQTQMCRHVSFFLHILTLSILVTFCLRRRRLCLRMSCDEELCSVEVLSLWLQTKRKVTADVNLTLMKQHGFMKL